MKRLLSIGLALSVAAIAGADEARTVPQGMLERYNRGDQSMLPRFMTEEEARIPQKQPDRLRLQPPSGDIYTPAEYEFNEGMFVEWDHCTGYSLIPFLVGTTTYDPDAIVWILVDSSSEQNTATNQLTSQGANMDQVQFITYSSNTGWIRDYGPRTIFVDGARAFMDHTYNRPRPADDAFPDFLCGHWGEPGYDLPLVHGGGNFHNFSNGDAFMTDLILLENSGMSEQDVIDIYADYHNVDLTIYPGFPWSVDGTKHIDMWMQPVGDDKVIIGEYPGDDSYEPHKITEDAVDDLEARGYTVYRTPGWNSGSGGYNGTHYTYTNAVVMNSVVFVPEFNGYATENAEALAAYEAAFPDRQVVQIDCSSIIHSAGAIHCSMMHVAGYSATMRVTPGLGLESEGPVGGPFTPENIVYTIENTSDGAIDYSVTNSEAWVSITNNSGTIPAGGSEDVTVFINDNADDLGLGAYQDLVEFTNLTNHEGDTTRAVLLTVGVPSAVHVFNLDEDPGWSMTGQWAFGHPTGQGGSQYGFADPSDGYTGTNVCGINLNGDYSTSVGNWEYLTTDAIDCSTLFDVELRFQRWLNCDYQPYVLQTVEVSDDGSDWDSVWSNGTSEITENSWSEQVYDISDVADMQATVYLRWGHKVDDSGAYAYSGWNIDDIQIWALAEEACPEDVNSDNVVDIDDLFAVLAHWGESEGAYDVNDDGLVDIDDVFAILSAWGPC